MVTTERRKWLALALLSVVQFMVVLDIAIVNVALPSIKVDLGFSQENLQWVISAYALVFGGFLLLGGRAADLLGRRRLFLAGIVVFTLASLLAGLAWSEASLIAARSLQGLGAAIISPAALSILSTTFTEGRERNIALGVWGAVGGFGAAAGVLLGGVLTEALSWSWIFFVNVPVGVAAFVLAPRLLDESRDTTVKSFDALGAVLVTGGLVVARLRDHPGRHVRLGLGARRSASSRRRSRCSAALRRWERRHAEPLMRFGILRTKTVAGANVGGLHPRARRTFSMFLMLTLYMQQVLGYSPMKTGVAYLAVAGSGDPLVGGRGAAREPRRREAGARHRDGRADGRARVLHAGLGRTARTSATCCRASCSSGVGLGFSFVPISIAALAGVRPPRLGSRPVCSTRRSRSAARSASRCCRRSRRRGPRDALADGTAPPSALVHGFTGAFVVGAGIAAVGIVAALTLIRRDELEQAPERAGARARPRGVGNSLVGELRLPHERSTPSPSGQPCAPSRLRLRIGRIRRARFPSPSTWLHRRV